METQRYEGNFFDYCPFCNHYGTLWWIKGKLVCISCNNIVDDENEETLCKTCQYEGCPKQAEFDAVFACTDYKEKLS